ncbi:hypothetical protein C8F04DRAFT_1119939, partial [Mycena alexandri]
MRFRISPRLPARDVPTHFGSPSPSITTVHAYTLSPPASSIADRRTATYCPGSARDLRRAVKVPMLSIGPRFPSFRGSLARWLGVADGAATRHGHPRSPAYFYAPFPFPYASRFLLCYVRPRRQPGAFPHLPSTTPLQWTTIHTTDDILPPTIPTDWLDYV